MSRRLIDATLCEKILADDLRDGDDVVTVSWVSSWLKIQDTIDAVEVVRCRNCICFMEFTPDHKQKMKAEGDCYFRVLNSMDEHFCCVKYEDYCSMGKRKETT